MGDLLKVIVKLNVSGDDRTSDNYNSYRVQLTNTLAGKEVQGIPLHLVLTNRGPGAKPTDPGPSEGAWIAAAPANEPRDAAAYKAASDAYFKWDTTYRVAHSSIMGAVLGVLHEACAQ